MNVTVKLISLSSPTTGQETNRYCRPGTTVLDVVSAIGIPDNQSFTIELNGIQASLNNLLHDGDVIAIMPVVIGT